MAVGASGASRGEIPGRRGKGCGTVTTAGRGRITPGGPVESRFPNDRERGSAFRSGFGQRRTLLLLGGGEDDRRSCGADRRDATDALVRSEEHTSELQSRENLVCRLLLE